MQVAVLANAKATRNARRKNLEAHVRRRFGAADIILTYSLEELAERAPAIHEKHYDMLIIYGGDGSFRHFYEVWFNTLGEKTAPPPVLPVPAGSQNYVSRDSGTYRSIFNIMGRIDRDGKLARAHWDPAWFSTGRRNLLRVEDPSVGRTQYAFVYTDGLFFRVGKKYYEMGATQVAALRALWGTAAQGFVAGREGEGVLSQAESVATLGEGDRQVSGHLALLLSTLDTILLNLRLFPDPTPLDRGFQAFALSSDKIRQNLIKLVTIGWRGGQGLQWVDPGVITGVFPEVTIKNSDGYALEGEIYAPPGGRTDLRITLGPSVRLVSM